MHRSGSLTLFLSSVVLLAAACSSGGAGGSTRTPAPAGTPAVVSTSTAPSLKTPVGTATTVAAAAPGAGVSGCVGSSLRATAGYQGATGSLGGSVTVTNDSSAPCTLQGQPQLRIEDGDGRALQVAPIAPPGMTTEANLIELPAGGKAFVTFIWTNWCASQPKGPLSIVVPLPAPQGEVAAPVEGSSATHVETPRCDSTSEPSVLSVGVFTRK